MQIASTKPTQIATGTVKNIPVNIMSTLQAGGEVEAVVSARLNADVVQLKLAGKVVEVESKLPLVPGQKVVISEGDESTKPNQVKLTTVSAISATDDANVPLKIGQKLAAEVVQHMPGKKLLLSPQWTSSQVNLPKQIELDVQAFVQQFKVGDKLLLEVLQMSPLGIKLSPQADANQAKTIDLIQRQLLPLIASLKQAPELFSVANRSEVVVNDAVKTLLNHLLRFVPEKGSLNQAAQIQAALQNSGAFLENKLKAGLDANNLGMDFKANLMKLGEGIKQQLNLPVFTKLLASPELLTRYPAEVQQAMQQIVASPDALKNLPAQIAQFLSERGIKPSQLLSSLVVNSHTEATTTSSRTAPQTLDPLTSFSVLAKQNTSLLTQIEQSKSMNRLAEVQVLRELLRDVETATAKIQYNQLSMLKENEGSPDTNVWIIDVPFKEKLQLRLMQMRVEQHKPGEIDDEIWQVMLNLETQNLGPVQAVISLHRQDVKVTFIAEKPSSVDFLNQHLDELNKRILAAGLSISQLCCQQGVAKSLHEDLPESTITTKLVDISV